jgi:hypothetical protein
MPPEPAEDDFLYLPEDQATAPTKGLFFQRYPGMWWAVRPGYGLVFFNPKNRRTGRRKFSYLGAPQCNVSERIKQATAETLPFEVEVRKFPLVWVQVNLRDYRD